MLEDGLFCLPVWKNIFTLRMGEHWAMLLREVMEFPPLEIFNTQVGKILSNCRNLRLALF